MRREIEKLVGCGRTDSLDDVWAPGIWFRVQPAGLGLEHKSECSDGSLSCGVHVMQNLSSALRQEGVYQFLDDGNHELVIVRGPENLPDTGDVEGFVLPIGRGEIIGRFDFAALLEELEEEI